MFGLGKLFSLGEVKEDEFRIRTVTTKNGRKIFFPEYKPRGYMQQWSTIVLINSRVYKAMTDLSTDDPDYSVSELEVANVYCTEYNRQLLKQRGEEVESEDVVEVTF